MGDTAASDGALRRVPFTSQVIEADTGALILI
jgi:hypothetical protein